MQGSCEMVNRTFGKRNLTVCEAKLQFNTVSRPSHNTYCKHMRLVTASM
jgi:hypothetical protein